MQKKLINNLFLVLLAAFSLAGAMGVASAKEDTAKARLVLMPLRVSEEIKNMRGAMETALAQGLQRQYEVFVGELVEQKAKAVFLQESRNMGSKDCNEIRCLQHIAEAFQSELIAVAQVTHIDGGYLLSLNIQNIFDNKAVYSNAVPCKHCDGFQVLEKLKTLNADIPADIPQTDLKVSPASTMSQQVVSENALWESAQNAHTINAYQAYLAQFPKGKFSALAEGRINLLREQASREQAQQEQDAWNDAITGGSIASYQEYLRRYPQGAYLVQAQARIRKLQNEQGEVQADIKPGSEFRDCPECPLMVVVPAGKFIMGSNHGDENEQPAHPVSIERMFAMSKTEITQGQWRAMMSKTVERSVNRPGDGLRRLAKRIDTIFPEHRNNWNAARRNHAEPTSDVETVVIDDNPSNFKDCGDECPVEQVSWQDTQEYIANLVLKTGKHYRLPSEAEWEYACRGGAYNEHCGGDIAAKVAWFGPPVSNARTTHSVAGLQANGYGLFDMSGNVWEWVSDNYHANYGGAPADGSSWLGSSVKHTLRGGSWSSKPEEMRATVRAENASTIRGSVGFRIVRELP